LYLELKFLCYYTHGVSSMRESKFENLYVLLIGQA